MQNIVYNTVPFVYKSDYGGLYIHVHLCKYTLVYTEYFFVLYRHINKILLIMGVGIGRWGWGRNISLPNTLLNSWDFF